MTKLCENFDILYPTELGTYRADGFAGHFIAAYQCRFRLHHHILNMAGERYRVSTVGEYKYGLGCDDRKYETMVFKEYLHENGYLDFYAAEEIDMERSDDSVEATVIHYKLVNKWTS